MKAADIQQEILDMINQYAPDILMAKNERAIIFAIANSLAKLDDANEKLEKLLPSEIRCYGQKKKTKRTGRPA